MGNVRIVSWNNALMVSIANKTNREICVPAAERVAAAARDPHHPELAQFVRVGVDPRAGFEDWAHAAVFNDHPHAMKVEAKHGVLGRALGSA